MEIAHCKVGLFDDIERRKSLRPWRT